MSDEALRALEKKWRDLAENSGRVNAISGASIQDVINRGLLNCSDELAALITTRQEVAPVAKSAREVLENERWRLMNSFGNGAYEDGICQKRIDEIDAQLSTGQTSDARHCIDPEQVGLAIDAAMRQEGGKP